MVVCLWYCSMRMTGHTSGFPKLIVQQIVSHTTMCRCHGAFVPSFCTYLFMLTNHICPNIEVIFFLCESCLQVAEHWGARQGHSNARPLYRGNRVNSVRSFNSLFHCQSYSAFFFPICKITQETELSKIFFAGCQISAFGGFIVLFYPWQVKSHTQTLWNGWMGMSLIKLNCINFCLD